MPETPALQIRGLSKTFPGQRALADVDVELQPGEIRALVGQNGCGKSTMIKVLAGFHEPDPGAEVFVDGDPLALGSQARVTMPACASFIRTSGWCRRWTRLTTWPWAMVMSATAWASSVGGARHGLPVRHSRIWATTSTSGNRPVIWSSANAQLSHWLVRCLRARRLPESSSWTSRPRTSRPLRSSACSTSSVASRNRGVAVLFVSHHLDEVFTLCDTVTVLRDGRHIITRPVEGLDEDALIALMIGRKLEQFDMPESAPESHGRRCSGFAACGRACCRESTSTCRPER